MEVSKSFDQKMFGPTFIRPEILLKQKVVLDYQKQKFKNKNLEWKKWVGPTKNLEDEEILWTRFYWIFFGL